MGVSKLLNLVFAQISNSLRTDSLTAIGGLIPANPDFCCQLSIDCFGVLFTCQLITLIGSIFVEFLSINRSLSWLCFVLFDVAITHVLGEGCAFFSHCFSHTIRLSLNSAYEKNCPLSVSNTKAFIDNMF